MSDSYQRGYLYEIFIKRAHRVYDGNSRNGGQGAYMKNLLDTANGKDLKKLAGSYEKQFSAVANYIQKAIDKFLKMNLTPEERQGIEVLALQLQRAKDPDDLMVIIDRGLEITRRLK